MRKYVRTFVRGTHITYQLIGKVPNIYNYRQHKFEAVFYLQPEKTRSIFYGFIKAIDDIELGQKIESICADNVNAIVHIEDAKKNIRELCRVKLKYKYEIPIVIKILDKPKQKRQFC